MWENNFCCNFEVKKCQNNLITVHENLAIFFSPKILDIMSRTYLPQHALIHVYILNVDIFFLY